MDTKRHLTYILTHMLRPASVLWFFLSMGLAAQTMTDQMLKDFAQPEDPFALFQAGLDDADVELDIQGSWKTSISQGVTIPIESLDGASTALPGFEDLAWTNAAELMISLWYQKMFFFEANFLQTFTKNTFLLGYENNEAQGLRVWHIGNKEIGLTDSGLLPFSTSPADSPGSHVVFGADNAQAGVLMRLTNRQTHTQSFLGTQALNAQEIPASSWLRGRFFRLPWLDVQAVQIYVESSSGLSASDGRKYRLLSPSEILVFSPARGLIGLKEKPAGKVLVFQDGSGASGPQTYPVLDGSGIDPANGVAFSESDTSSFVSRVISPLQTKYGWPAGTVSGLRVNVDGHQTLTVWIPDTFSPFEDASWYSLPAGSTIRQTSIKNGSLGLDAEQDGSVFQLVLPDESPESIISRYPLMALADHHFYLPGDPYPDEAVPTIVLSLTEAGAVSGMVLDENAIPSSIQVWKNSVPVMDFNYDSTTRILVLNPVPGSGDLITVTYDTSDSSQDANTLQVGLQGSLDLDKENHLSAGLGLEWPVTEDLLESGTGMVGLGLGFHHEDANLDFSVRLKGYWAQPSPGGRHILQEYSGSRLDLFSTGSLFLPGENPGYSLLLNEFDRSAPLDVSDTGHAASFRTVMAAGVYFSEAGRAFPLSHSVETVEGSLAGWKTEGTQISESGYLVTSPFMRSSEADDPFVSKVAVLEFGTDHPGNWTSVQILLSDEQVDQVQKTSTISFWVSGLGNTSQAHLLVRTGKTSEDLDSDAVMDTRDSSAGGIVLSHAPWPLPLLVQGDSSSLINRGEDQNSNGLLDGGLEGTAVLKYAGHIPATSGSSGAWARVDWVLDGSERRSIAASRSITFILAGDDGSGGSTALAGKFGIAGLQCDLPGLVALDSSTGTMLAGVQSDAVLAQELASAFPDLGVGDSNQGRGHYVLSPGESGGFVQVMGTRNLAEGTITEFYLYIKPGSVLPDTMELSLRNGEEPTARASISSGLPLGEWLKVSIDALAGTLNINKSDGSVADQGNLVFDHRDGTWDRMMLTVENKGASTCSGIIYLDSFLSRQALGRFAGSASGDLSLKFPGALVKSGDLDIVSDFSLAVKATVDASIFSSAAAFLDSRSSAWAGIQASAGITLFWTRLGIGFHLENPSEDPEWGLDYSVSLPELPSAPVKISHRFSIENSDIPVIKNAIGLDLGSKDLVYLDSDLEFSNGTTTRDTRKLSASAGFAAGKEFRADTALTMEQTELSPLYINAESGWIDSWSLLFNPVIDPAISRNLDLIGSLSSTTGPVSMMLKADLGSVRNLLGVLSNKAILMGKFGFGDDSAPLNVGIEYSRQIEYADNPSRQNLEFEATRLFQSLGWTRAFSLLIPFEEFFDPLLGSEFDQALQDYAQAKLTQDMILHLDRPQDTDITALFLPKSASLEVKQEYDLARPGLSRNSGFRWSLDWKTLNLLGTSGTVKSLDFYETDSIDLVAAMSHAWKDGAYSASMFHEKLALGLSGLTFPDDLNKSWKEKRDLLEGLIELQDIASLKFFQEMYLRDDYPLVDQAYGFSFAWAASLPEWKPEFLGKKSKAPAFLHNLEYLGVQSHQGNGDTADFLLSLSDTGNWNLFPLVVTLMHTTTLVIPDWAYLSIGLGIGLGGFGEETPGRTGLIARLEAKIKL